MTAFPQLAPRFLALWAINGALVETRLFRQLDDFRAAGLDGVVFRPRFYPGGPEYLGPEYLRLLSRVILHAQSLGLAFWLHDDDGWPSGPAAGRMLREHPQLRQRWLACVRVRPALAVHSFSHGGLEFHLKEVEGPSVDYFNPDLARAFLDLTHKRYREGLDPAAWAYVESMFCDQPEFGLGHSVESLPPDGAVPWTPDLPARHEARHGVKLEPLLPLLFVDGPGSAEVRERFWELCSDLLNESFTASMDAWCRAHGKVYTSQVRGEEHPLFQVPTSGSCGAFFRTVGLPGIDALGRYPSNDYSPRQVSSAARQFGTGRCMAEVFGGAGWGAAPADLERHLLWLGRNGLTDFVLHLSQYRLDSAALHDWPPSLPSHVTWSAAFPEVIARVRVELAQQPRRSAGTLVVSPHRGLMRAFAAPEFLHMDRHNASAYADTEAGRINRRFLRQIEALVASGLSFDVADERTLERHGRMDDGIVHLGACSYRQVFLADGAVLRADDIAAFAQSTRNETVSPFGLRSPAAPVEVAETVPEWSLASEPINSLLPDVERRAADTWSARFECSEPARLGPLSLRFADTVNEVIFNGRTLATVEGPEGSSVCLPTELVRPMNLIQFKVRLTEGRPFVWVEGAFRALSATDFEAGPEAREETVATPGPFRLHPPGPIETDDMIAAGFPFLFRTLLVEAELYIPAGTHRIALRGLCADAVRLHWDGGASGWAWPTDGRVVFASVPPAGRHWVRLELAPNGFNHYGPHHYYLGDHYVVTPGQVSGVRNFADPEGSPACTHILAWHLRKFQLPTGLVFLRQA